MLNDIKLARKRVPRREHHPQKGGHSVDSILNCLPIQYAKQLPLNPALIMLTSLFLPG